MVSRRLLGRGLGLGSSLDGLDDDGLLDEDGLLGRSDTCGDGDPDGVGHDIPDDRLLVQLLVVVVDGSGCSEGSAQHAENGGRAHGFLISLISGLIFASLSLFTRADKRQLGSSRRTRGWTEGSRDWQHCCRSEA